MKGDLETVDIKDSKMLRKATSRYLDEGYAYCVIFVHPKTGKGAIIKHYLDIDQSDIKQSNDIFLQIALRLLQIFSSQIWNPLVSGSCQHRQCIRLQLPSFSLQAHNLSLCHIL